MTYGAFTPRAARSDLAPLVVDRRPRSSSLHAVICGLALTIGTGLGVWMLYADPVVAVAPTITPIEIVARPVTRASAVSPRPIAGLFDPAFDGDHTPATFDQTVLLAARFKASAPIEQDTDSPLAAAAEPSIVPALPLVSELVRDVPLPLPRPAFLVPQPRLAARPTPTGAPATGQDQPSFFDRLFGSRPAPGTALAYAAPDDGEIGRGPVARTIAAYGQRAAVYDIAAHTVYLPGGGRLEAHSGLGARLDDPRGVAEHMRGATPPAVYELSLRAQPFHGVRALRLNPIGGGTVYGRAGLLAHTYMLGPRGDSNGCVVFRDYRSFLQAYESGAVNRLVVVASLN